MLLDHKNSRWIVGTVLIACAAAGVYFWDAPRHPHGGSGSTIVGIVLGSVALALMLIAAGLGMRRKVPHWRLGRAQTWMRAHIWGGLLTVWLVVLHSGFRVGGPLTTAIWVLLITVTLSGIVGLILQQCIPSILMVNVPGETIAQQLKREIDDLNPRVAAVLKLMKSDLSKPLEKRKLLRPSRRKTDPPNQPPGTPESAASPGDQTASKPADTRTLEVFVDSRVTPYLAGDSSSILHHRTRSIAVFVSIKAQCSPVLEPAIDAISEICARRRELLQQRRLMRMLFGWLILHVPLSWMLLVMVVFHSVIALRYMAQ